MTTRRLTIEVVIESRKAAEAVRAIKSDVQSLGGTVRSVTGPTTGLDKAFAGLGRQVIGAAAGFVSVAAAAAFVRKSFDLAVDSVARASREFASFDQEMRNVGAVSGATREELAALGDEALRLAKVTRFSPEQTAKALYSLASAGLAAKEQIAALPAVLDFAEAAQADLGLSSELVVRQLKAFKMEASEARRVADVLTAAIGASSLNAERLAFGMAQAAPAAAVLGQNLETTVAAVALLVDQMGSGEMAGAGLKQSMLTLMAQADDLGIQVQDSTGKFRDLVDIVRDLETAGTAGEKILAELGTRAGPAMSILVSQGADALEAMRDKISSSGQAATVASEQLDTLQGDYDIFASTQDEFWKRLGSKFEGGTRQLVQTMTAGLDEMISLVENNGEQISRAWLVTVNTMIGSAEFFGLAIARIADQFLVLGDAVGGFAKLLPPEFKNLILLSVKLNEQARGLSESPGPAEAAFKEFFDNLREGAKAAASAIEDIGESSAEMGAGVAAALREMGFDPATLRSLEEVRAEMENIARFSDVDLAGAIKSLGIEISNLRDIDQLGRVADELERLQRISDFETLTTSLAGLGIAVTNLFDLDQLKAANALLEKMVEDTKPKESLGVSVDKKLLEKIADLRNKLAQATRQEEFLIAAFRRGEAEFRRAERVVAAYNAVLVDGKAQLDLFDEALKLEGLKTQRENLERLDKNFQELAKNIATAEDAYRDFIDSTAFVGSDAAAARPVDQQDQRGFADYTESEWAAYLAAIDLVSDEYLEIVDSQGKILDTLTDWQGAAYIIADAFQDVNKELADIFGTAGDFLGALTRINTEGGKLAATLAGLDTLRAVGNAVSGPNNYGAEGAAAGALIGALVGAYYGGASGAQAGAALGGAAGGALGSFVKKGVDEFLGSIREAEGYALGQMGNVRNSLSQIGKQYLDAITRGINDAVDALGGELAGLPQLDIKVRDGIYSVFSNGIVARFSSMQEAVDFAILQALREGAITGLSDEVRAALENSTAESFAAMAQDLDFARWVEGLPEVGEAASQSAQLLDQAIDGYRSALRKAEQLGIDFAKIDQDFARNLTNIRNSILGIVETDEQRIRRESEAFNREVQLLEAEQLAKKADLMIQEQMLRADLALFEARTDLTAGRINLEGELLRAETALMQGKMLLLDAVTKALASIDTILGNLPNLISEGDIQAAIRRARGAGGGQQRAEAREDIQTEVLLYGLSDVRAALHEAGRFAADFAERIKGMGFSAEEAARLMALAQEEQARLQEEVRADVRQTYYDAIAQAQGLSEIWGVLDQFRDLRQDILDAGLSAEETAERLRGIDWAEDVELAKIEVGIIDRLFGYLQGEEAWAAQSVEFAKMKVELEFGIMRAQLQLLGVFEQYVAVFDAALAAALKAVEIVDVVEPPVRRIRDNFRDTARDAERIAESFARAKLDVADFLNEMLVGQYGGVSPVGGVEEATRQFDEVLRQALTGNIGAIESFDDYGSTLLRLARDAHGSSPEFQAIYDYVLAAGRDVLNVSRGREGNLVFDERFYRQNEQQIDLQAQQVDLLARVERHLSRQQGRPIAGQGVN